MDDRRMSHDEVVMTPPDDNVTPGGDGAHVKQEAEQVADVSVTDASFATSFYSCNGDVEVMPDTVACSEDKKQQQEPTPAIAVDGSATNGSEFYLLFLF